jgi:SAM-dependent methyltransferase
MNFDPIAPHYRWIELLGAGGTLQRCRTAFLQQIPAPKNVLILGEGNGRFLTGLRRQFAGAAVTCVDSSARMLDLARARLVRHQLHTGNIRFIHADALAWPPPHKEFDLIATHFFLDCFRMDQVAALVEKLGAAATSDALWLLSDFQIPARGLRRCRARLILWMLYAFFRATARLPARKLVCPDHFLKEAGFTLAHRRLYEWDLLRADWWGRNPAPQR